MPVGENSLPLASPNNACVPYWKVCGWQSPAIKAKHTLGPVALACHAAKVSSKIAADRSILFKPRSSSATDDRRQLRLLERVIPSCKGGEWYSRKQKRSSRRDTAPSDKGLTSWRDIETCFSNMFRLFVKEEGATIRPTIRPTTRPSETIRPVQDMAHSRFIL